MSGTMKTAFGPHYKIDDIPFLLEGFLSAGDRKLLLDVCDYAQTMSRISFSRLTKTTHSTNMPVLASFQMSLLYYLSDLLKINILPISNTYYVFEKGAHFQLRTTSISNQLTLFIFLDSESKKKIWPFKVSEPATLKERLSEEFPGGIIYDLKSVATITNQSSFFEFSPSQSDAILFSGSNCFHYFEGENPAKLRMVCFNFNMVSGS